jgi:hypothetical protein
VLSHDLARILLARRNNDIRVEILVDDDPTGEREIYQRRIGLRDGVTLTCGYYAAADDLVVYDGKEDVVVIKAAFVVVGEPT